ncbi:MAG TPA: polysaccharide deacetylase family protein [Bacteroidales bacterium]|nr:polysaccharide deacetylase family protein [Bacteroidales bacterium]HOK98171.1 polysaccharide deacetylase family protein [Bacteroidales bacterium]HPO65250.1 polysaccharide deacetylase family protein [Bacteroidales bacterium]
MGQLQQIVILTEFDSPRLRYVVQHIFGNILGIEPILCQQEEEYNSSSLPKICYMPAAGKEGLHIIPAGLLKEQGTTTYQLTDVKLHQQVPLIFQSPNPDSLGFDVFSAIFFVLSRYEEYNTAQIDSHGRYLPTTGVFATNNLYAIPVVDEWVKILKNKLIELYPRLTFKKHTYTYLPTIDVDMPYAYRFKKLPYAIGGTVKNVYRAEWQSLKTRLEVILGRKTDPYDTFDFLNITTAKYSVTPIYFYLCNGQKPHDPIAAYRKRALIDAIGRNKPFALAGLHNSYHSLDNPTLIEAERKKLESISGNPIVRSRFHYIRFQIPVSYQHLIQAGIAEDYSMGFASINGFRAGTSHPFFFYDLSRETITNLKLFPFQAMDATYVYYLKYSPQAAYEDMIQIRERVRQHEGTLIIIWHNNTFEPTPEGMQWRRVFEAMFE